MECGDLITYSQCVLHLPNIDSLVWSPLGSGPTGIRGCLEKALVMKFTLTPGVQALHTQAGGPVMYVLSVNE